VNSWEEAVAFACSLPDVVMEKWWGTASPRINGKGFMSPGREAGSFALMVTKPGKEMLFETHSDLAERP
jgi:hypothetical protein